MKMCGHTIISNEIFFKEIKNLLEKGTSVCIRAQGDSMRPFLRTNDSVYIIPAAAVDIETGKIVLATVQGKTTVLHRIYRIKNNQIYLMGDGNLKKQEIISVDDIIGIATHILKENNEQKLYLYTPRKRLSAFIWRKLLFCRRILLRL